MACRSPFLDGFGRNAEVMDDPPSTSVDGVWTLCEKLRAERLLVTSEMETLVSLHTDIADRLTNLGLLEWSSQQHQLVLHRLLSSHESVQPESSCAIICKISELEWLEAYKRLDHHCPSMEAALNILFSAPRTVAELLHTIDSLPHEDQINADDIVRAVFSLVYGHSVFPNDERLVLDVLSSLIDLQVARHPDPRLLLRRGNSAFCRLYKLFTEGLFAAKIFLTAALHDAVMLVLCQDEIFLDIDPSKSPLRFPSAERARRFGSDPNSVQYQKRVAQHRKMIVEKLVLLAFNFLKGICDSMSCFPASLTWLVQQMHHTLTNKGISADQAALICTDLIVTNLLCPAITNPENVGVISDTPVGHIARFNLMQIGQIVQMLALSKYEQPPSHMQLFAVQFKENEICQLVQNLLSRRLPSLDSLFPTVLSETNKSAEIFRRSHFLGSLYEVNSILRTLKSSAPDGLSNADHKKDLRNLVKRMPNMFMLNEPVSSTTDANQNEKRNKLRMLSDRVSSRGKSASVEQPNATPVTTLPSEYFDLIVFRMYDEDEQRLGLQQENIFMEQMKHERKERKHKLSDEKEKRTRFLETGSTGMNFSEVGSAISECTTDPVGSDMEDGENDEVGSLSSSIDQPQEDRLLLLDEDGASTLPDNVSDVGAMSARGSPSLSGRETPLSQAGLGGRPNEDHHGLEEQEETEAEVAAASTAAGDLNDPARRQLPPLPVTVRKPNAEGLEEKFGKFSLPPNQGEQPYRDDQRSLLSDSWSTDVVPSDNEGPSVPPLMPFALPNADNLTPYAANRHGRPAVVGRSGSLGGSGLAAGGEDRSDTWSLDAIASDSEADGTRERDADRENAQQQEQAARAAAVAASVPSSNPVLVDNLISLDPVNSPGAPSSGGNRMRRQSSGSSFLSKSDLESEISSSFRDHDETVAVPKEGGPPTERQSPPLPPRPSQPTQEDRPSSSGAYFGSPARDSLAEQPIASGSGLRGKKMAIFQGLRNVGDRIGDKMKGMASSSLRQSIPHSSTLSDLIGSLPDWPDRKDVTKLSTSESQPSNLNNAGSQQSADDILAKYKSKPSVVLVDVTSDGPPQQMAPSPPLNDVMEEAATYYDPSNLTQCRAFSDAKRKLRLVLSNVGSLPTVVMYDKRHPMEGDECSERIQLARLLRILLAEAINSREQVLSAHIREVLRVMTFFDDKGIRKLLRTLRDEHRKRTSYVLYLQQSRLTLLRLSSHINKLSQRIERERNLTRECLVEVLVRYYVDNHDHTLKRLVHEFSHLKAQDEKTDLLSRTLHSMWQRLEENSMWRDANSHMLDYARKGVERLVMSQIHNIAFYPNGEADVYRDDVFHRSLSRLARTITPDHPMLRIPKILHGEAPWPSAQAEIAILNAYKSARDKLQCVVRACTTISNLIALAEGVGPAAADDLTPVLVYVLIQANPPALLSNVQYVQGFIESDLSGSEQYWWTQFTAAIEFIKTLL